MFAYRYVYVHVYILQKATHVPGTFEPGMTEGYHARLLPLFRPQAAFELGRAGADVDCSQNKH